MFDLVSRIIRVLFLIKWARNKEPVLLCDFINLL